MTIPEPLNADYIDAMYQRHQSDPASVPAEWRFFFEGFALGASGRPLPEAPPGHPDAPHPPTAGSPGPPRPLSPLSPLGPLSPPIPPIPSPSDAATRQSRVETLIRRHRDLGHLLACIDPLSACPTDHPLLNPSAMGITESDLAAPVATESLPGLPDLSGATLAEVLSLLRQTYCRAVGAEFTHLQDPEERGWLQTRMESTRNRLDPDPELRRRILYKLTQSAVFEGFLNKKYLAQTRFSLEGGDAVIPLLDALMARFVKKGGVEVIMGMAHRGRLNVQTHALNRPYADIFAQFEHCYDPDSVSGAGDVKYHNGYMTTLAEWGGSGLSVYLLDNPSHLESVNPLVEGAARARQDLLPAARRSEALPLLIHGDAAFAGQGVVAETLNMSQLEGYRTGGTVHLVINNQIGYTTLPADARSTRYSTDIAKMIMAPIFHVHGEDPEAVVHVARLAVDYRMRYAKDVVIDLICYRRFGHNEGDEPYFTQPAMYDRIKQRPSPHRLYADTLIADGLISEKDLAAMERGVEATVSEAFEEIRGGVCAFPVSDYYEIWSGYHGNYSHKGPDTGVPADRLAALAEKLNTTPAVFTPHPKLAGLLEKRLAAVRSGGGIDWGNAEALAFASLLTEGVPIRLSGQDVRRGTFSHRHCVMVDRKTEDRHTPLSHLSDDQVSFQAFDSLLAEVGPLSFEYGYSMVRPDGLTIWEAQFGDFVNNTQSVIDLYIASGETKWRRLSGLVMLLPHGLEGLGPEHSSARPERFLQLCAHDNMQVCHPTTPAQYFHLLRKQALASYRKPLIVLSPKSLLRHPKAVSDLSDLSGGGFFPVLDDPAIGPGGRKSPAGGGPDDGSYDNGRPDNGSPDDAKHDDAKHDDGNFPDGVIHPGAIEKVLLCGGKVYYELALRRAERRAEDIALIRVEQYYPFPRAALEAVAIRYANARQWCWVQEEPANMGAWNFIGPRLEILLDRPVRYIGRKTSASPATGFPKIYRAEQAAIIEEAVGPPPDQGPGAERFRSG